MSYAVESKKRKFDRLLGSLTDGAPTPARASINSSNNTSTSSVPINEAASDGSKRRRITPSSLINSLRPSLTPSLTTQYLPASRQAFLERLETYRQVTKWHIPSTETINAAVWAKRGWICVDTDTVFCGLCKERLKVDLDLETGQDVKDAEEHESDDGDDYTAMADIYDGLVKRYLQMTITAHTESCLWRKRGSDSSIQRIEGLLNTANAISNLKTRYTSISETSDAPPVEPFTDKEETQLSKFSFEENSNLKMDLLRLAVCGWQRKDVDVLECKHCFRSLGLWLYRGNLPAMEKLDAVESHLEYCPWRSPEAQDTELSLTTQTPSGPESKREKLPGWALVCMAITKVNIKKESALVEGDRPASPAVFDAAPSAELSPEQREKKVKDLMRRIKELKKPFNVRGLLRKDKTKAQI